METIRLRDRGRGFVSLKVRDGVVTGAMGSEPKRFLGLRLDQARSLAAGRSAKARGSASGPAAGAMSGS